MRKTNKFLISGLFIVVMTIITKHYFIDLPHFIEGLGLGIGIGLELIGVYLIKHDASKLKEFKRKLFTK